MRQSAALAQLRAKIAQIENAGVRHEALPYEGQEADVRHTPERRPFRLGSLQFEPFNGAGYQIISPRTPRVLSRFSIDLE